MRLHDLLPAPILCERREDVVAALTPYRHNGDIFISFTSQPKIGVNPKSSYNTPLGVYAYPLDEIWDDLQSDTIPFGSDRAYVQVIRNTAKNPLNVTNYGLMRYEADVEKLRRMAPLIFKGDDDEDAAHAFDDLVKDAEVTAMARGGIASRFWNVVRLSAERMATTQSAGVDRANPMGVAFSFLLRKLGYDAVIDKTGMQVIHRNEPKQAVFLTPGSYRHIAMLHNVRKVGFGTRKMGLTPEEMAVVNAKDGPDDRAAVYFLSREWVDLLLQGSSTHLYLTKTGGGGLAPDEMAEMRENFVDSGNLNRLLYNMVTGASYAKTYPTIMRDLLRFEKAAGTNIGHGFRYQFMSWHPSSLGKKPTEENTNAYLSTALNPDVAAFLTGNLSGGWGHLLRAVIMALRARHTDFSPSEYATTKRVLTSFEPYRAMFNSALGAENVERTLRDYA